MYAQTLVYGITAAVAFALVFRRLRVFRLHWNAAFQLSLLRGSLPYALSFFLMSVYTRLDTVMIERMLPDGAHEAGLYASAYRLLDASNMIGYLFASLLMPMFAKLVHEKTSVLPLARFSFQAIWVAAVTLAAACFAFREPIMHLLYTESNAYSADLLGWLMLSFPAVSTMYIFGCLLSANNTMRETNYLYGAGVVVNFGLNIVLIPHFHALGAAYATLFTQILIGLGLVFVAYRTFLWQRDVLFIVKISSFFVLNCLIFYILKHNTSLFWLYNIVIGGVCSLFLAVVMRLIEIGKVKMMLEK